MQSLKQVKRLAMCKPTQQLPTLLARLHGAKNLTSFNLSSTVHNTRKNMKQGVQTGATCNIQQCWELLANNVASVCKGLYTVTAC